MGMKSMPDAGNKKVSETGQDKPEKYLEFFDKNGLKTSVAVFKGESEQDALARARAIDARLGKKPTF
jgi:hypothetical protein